jgi:hypothetical protein
MDRRVHINQDVVAGLTFIAFGAFFLFFGRNYPIGSTLRMGPGYMPMLLGWSVVGVGAIIAIKGALSAGEKLTGWALRPLILINFAFFAFAWTIESMGLFVTALLAMMVAAVAGEEFKFREQLILALCMAVACAALFIYGLGLPMRYWPTFLDQFIYG